MTHSSIITIIESAFGKGLMTRDQQNFQVACPNCSNNKTGKKKLHIKLDDLRYHCWVCDLKGKNVLYLVAKVRPDLKINPKQKKYNKPPPSSQPDEEKVLLPKNLIPVYRPTKDPDIKSVKKYLLSRGVSVEKMMRWRIMATKTGSLRRHAIIPSFDNKGVLNYYVARSIDETTFRYKNAKKRKSEVIFNDIDIDWSKPLYLVEGVFDAIKCFENTVPILGSSLSRDSKLLNKILKIQPEVTVSLDPDMPEKAYKIADTLSSGGCSVYVAFAPKNKDMGDLSYSEARDVLSNRTKYDSYIKIRHKIGNLRSGSIF